jgi:hypothetical protein
MISQRGTENPLRDVAACKVCPQTIGSKIMVLIGTKTSQPQIIDPLYV